MGLGTKHINLLKSCSRFLKGKAGTFVAKQYGWDNMLNVYAKELDEIAAELEKLGLPETKVSLSDIFGGKGK